MSALTGHPGSAPSVCADTSLTPSRRSALMRRRVPWRDVAAAWAVTLALFAAAAATSAFRDRPAERSAIIEQQMEQSVLRGSLPATCTSYDEQHDRC